ncbi:MAG: hypothetical protein OEW14_20185, partial [Nitrospira sp.]|nr:hypothetical protein [Nitrospira sp.]
LSHTGTAERRSIYQPNRVSTESRDSDSPTVVQTHFRIGKYCDRGQVLEDVSRKEWLFDLFRCR